MSPEEAEMVRKTGGRGPGGCVRDECEAYCENPDNEEACFAFAKEHGLISEEDLAHMREGASRIREGLEHAGPEVIACMKREVGPNIIDEINNGTFSPSRRSGEAIKGCFEKHMERPNFPPEVEQCMKQVFGEDAIDKVMKGEIDRGEIERGIGPCVSELMRKEFGDDSFGRDGFEGEHRDDDFTRETFEGEFGGIGGEHDDRNELKIRIDEERLRVEEKFRRDFETNSDSQGQIDDTQNRVFEEEKRRIEEQVRLETEKRIREQQLQQFNQDGSF